MQTALAPPSLSNIKTVFAMAQQYDVIHVEKQSGGVSSRMEHEEDRTEKETKKATCEEAGEKQLVCDNCGEVVKTETDSPLSVTFKIDGTTYQYDIR